MISTLSYITTGLIMVTGSLDLTTYKASNPGRIRVEHTSSSRHPIDTTYTFSKNQVAVTKSHIRTGRISADSLSALFTFLLTEKIIPHWLGTPWSFEGHTAIPRQGEIACGYFVSTTLKDMGFNLNRYTMAQQTPINEAKTLSISAPVTTIESGSVDERIRLLTSGLPEGIHLIGFGQSHVGYLQKKKDRLFLIHSNYINSEGVVIEPVESSMVFATYPVIHIAEISSNKALLKKWLSNESLVIHTGE